VLVSQPVKARPRCRQRMAPGAGEWPDICRAGAPAGAGHCRAPALALLVVDTPYREANTESGMLVLNCANV
jgi:hypothetical protein